MHQKAQNTARYYNNLSARYDRVYSSYLTHTHQKLLERIDFTTLSDCDILDVSAGTGILAEELIEKFGTPGRMVLNDPAEKMLAIARDKFTGLPGVEYSSCFAEKLDQLDGTFDHLFCLNSFHYYVDQTLALQHMKSLLKPGGILWIQDWNRTGIFRIANRLIGLLSPEHINTRNLAEMKTLLMAHDFEIIEQHHWRFRWWKFFFIKCRIKQ